jgi:hypothetical protein
MAARQSICADFVDLAEMVRGIVVTQVEPSFLKNLKGHGRINTYIE